jgi:ubiquitin
VFENLTTRPDPLVYFVIVFPISLLALAGGYFYAARSRWSQQEKAGWAYGLGQAAIFALIALILGFSFSFAAGRYEARRGLVVTEADAIRTAFLRAAFLPGARSVPFRHALVEYTRARLESYEEVEDPKAERAAIDRGKHLQGQLWTMATNAVLRDPRSTLFADVTRSVVETINASEEQLAALSNHVPRPIIFIIILCTIVGAFLFGLTFGYAKEPHALLSAIFCLLFAATVFTIVDLDHPQGGFIAVDVTPLQSLLEDMTNSPATQLIRSQVR